MMGKREQIARTREEFTRLMDAIAGLDEQELTTPDIDQWSVREVLAHIAGWTRLDTQIMRRLARGERPLAEGEDYGTGESRNPGFAAEAGPKSAQAVIDDLVVVFDEFLTAAEAVPGDRFADGRTAQRIMHESASEHLKEHRAEIESWRKTLRRSTN
jgi:DinB family protein